MRPRVPGLIFAASGGRVQETAGQGPLPAAASGASARQLRRSPDSPHYRSVHPDLLRRSPSATRPACRFAPRAEFLTRGPSPVRPFRHIRRSVDRRDQACPRGDRPRTRPALAAALARPARAGLLRWADLPPHAGDAVAAAARVLRRGDLPVPALGHVRDRVPARGLVVQPAMAADRLSPVLPDPARRQGVAVPAAGLLLRPQPAGDAGAR